MLVGRGSQGATGRAKEDSRVKHFCSGKTILVESAVSADTGHVPDTWWSEYYHRASARARARARAQQASIWRLRAD
eukprot:1948677-Prymnesium_polylepis.1